MECERFIKHIKMEKAEVLKAYKDLTMKDVDFEKLVLEEKLSIDILPKDLEIIMTTIERDLVFLRENKLMDYSLLLGIERNNKDINQSILDLPFAGINEQTISVENSLEKVSSGLSGGLRSTNKKKTESVQRASSVNLSK